MAVTIAHLSDLHFGMAGQQDTWQQLKAFLMQRQPDLVLITGDIADSAQAADLAAASRALSDLRDAGLTCYVCPGNHDRHLQGNATRGVPGATAGAVSLGTRWWNRLSRARDPAIASEGGTPNAALFDQLFNKLGMIVPTGAPVDVALPTRSPQWRIRLLALDSSADAQFLAQGFVGPDMLAGLRSSAPHRAADDTAPDLVVVLVHHHLLPVAALEGTRQSVGGLLASTTLINAGTVLATLVDCGADLVLHGHEHVGHLARYGTLDEGRGEIVVIGAASATGADTRHGSQLEHSAFNLIHLGDDLGVSLQEMRYRAGTWHGAGGPRHLLGAVDIRRGRYLRRRSVSALQGALPSSRVLKQFTYTVSRDATIRQVTTNCLIRDHQFSIQTENTSGVPYFVGGAIELPSGETLELERSAGPMSAIRGSTYEHCESLFNLGPGTAVVRRVEHEIMWVGGGVLTRDDLSRCDARDPRRQDGREFVAMEVSDSLEALTLAVELPAGHGPRRRDDVQVRVLTPAGHVIPRPELTERLRFTGMNRIAVNIPYPLAGYTYQVSWLLPDVPPVDATLGVHYQKLDRVAQSLALQMASNLAKLAPGPDFSVGIYVPSTDAALQGLEFRLVGSTSRVESVPANIRPMSNRHPFCYAFWGVPFACTRSIRGGAVSDDDAESSVLPHEGGIIALPIPSFFGGPASGLGVARVAWPLQEAENGVENLLVRATAALQGSTHQLFDLVR
jgi:Calcineurin-like phosphoesterase